MSIEKILHVPPISLKLLAGFPGQPCAPSARGTRVSPHFSLQTMTWQFTRDFRRQIPSERQSRFVWVKLQVKRWKSCFANTITEQRQTSRLSKSLTANHLWKAQTTMRAKRNQLPNICPNEVIRELLILAEAHLEVGKMQLSSFPHSLIPSFTRTLVPSFLVDQQ